jgi:hypothetical protein
MNTNDTYYEYKVDINILYKQLGSILILNYNRRFANGEHKLVVII